MPAPSDLLHRDPRTGRHRFQALLQRARHPERQHHQAVDIRPVVRHLRIPFSVVTGGHSRGAGGALDGGSAGMYTSVSIVIEQITLRPRIQAAERDHEGRLSMRMRHVLGPVALLAVLAAGCSDDDDAATTTVHQ